MAEPPRKRLRLFYGDPDEPDFSSDETETVQTQQPDNLWDLLPNDTRIIVGRELDRVTRRKLTLTVNPGIPPRLAALQNRLDEFERQWMTFYDFETPEQLHAFLQSIPLQVDHRSASYADTFLHYSALFEHHGTFQRQSNIIGWTARHHDPQENAVPIFLDRRQFLKVIHRANPGAAYVAQIGRIGPSRDVRYKGSNSINLVSPTGTAVSQWPAGEVMFEPVLQSDLGLDRLFRDATYEAWRKATLDQVQPMLECVSELLPTYDDDGIDDADEGASEEIEIGKRQRVMEDSAYFIQWATIFRGLVMHYHPADWRTNDKRDRGRLRIGDWAANHIVLLERTFRLVNELIETDNPISQAISQLKSRISSGAAQELDTVLVSFMPRQDAGHLVYSHYWERAVVMYALNGEFGTDEVLPEADDVVDNNSASWLRDDTADNSPMLQLFKLWAWRHVRLDEPRWKGNIRQLLFDEKKGNGLKKLRAASLRKVDGGVAGLADTVAAPSIERYFRVQIVD